MTCTTFALVYVRRCTDAMYFFHSHHANVRISKDTVSDRRNLELTARLHINFLLSSISSHLTTRGAVKYKFSFMELAAA